MSLRLGGEHDSAGTWTAVYAEDDTLTRLELARDGYCQHANLTITQAERVIALLKAAVQMAKAIREVQQDEA